MSTALTHFVQAHSSMIKCSRRGIGPIYGSLKKLSVLKPALLRICLIAVVLGTVVASAAPPVIPVENGSIAQAYKIIASKRFVDLTHSFSPVTPI